MVLLNSLGSVSYLSSVVTIGLWFVI